jgi:hypothetical protein
MGSGYQEFMRPPGEIDGLDPFDPRRLISIVFN